MPKSKSKVVYLGDSVYVEVGAKTLKLFLSSDGFTKEDVSDDEIFLNYDSVWALVIFLIKEGFLP